MDIELSAAAISGSSDLASSDRLGGLDCTYTVAVGSSGLLIIAAEDDDDGVN